VGSGEPLIVKAAMSAVLAGDSTSSAGHEPPASAEALRVSPSHPGSSPAALAAARTPAHRSGPPGLRRPGGSLARGRGQGAKGVRCEEGNSTQAVVGDAPMEEHHEPLAAAVALESTLSSSARSLP
jgi:hypothetical protein